MLFAHTTTFWRGSRRHRNAASQEQSQAQLTATHICHTIAWNIE